jgi:hypothetical protein
MSNLQDLIRLEIERGNLAEPFTVANVRALIDSNHGILGDEAAPEFLASYLANHSTGPGARCGEAIKRGGPRLFIKHDERATYSLDYDGYDLEIEDTSDLEGDEPQNTRRAPRNESGPSSRRRSSRSRRTRRLPPFPPGSAGTVDPSAPRDHIALLFVEYLRHKPIRILKTTPYGLKWDLKIVSGWWDRLNAYYWKKHDWKNTKPVIGAFIKRLAALEASPRPPPATAKKIYDDIKKGGNPKGSSYSGVQVLALLRPLWTGNTITAVDSTLTKLYAFARANEYAIYDSRVAAAILTIAEDIFRPKSTGTKLIDTVQYFQSYYPRLGLYNGTGGTRQRGYRSRNWPVAYAVVDAQYDANDLCKRIRDTLNALKEDDRSSWTLRDVEAVLFMEGY